MDKADFLKQHPIAELETLATFGALSPESIEWLINQGQLLKLEKHEVIFEPDQPGDSFFIIISGEVSYYRIRHNRDTFIRSYNPGHEIGFVSTIALHDRLGKVVAESESLVLKIDTDVFYRFYETDPSNFGILVLNLSREMARTIGKMDQMINTLKSDLEQNKETKDTR